MLSKLDFVNNFYRHVTLHDVIVSTAVFRLGKKKKNKEKRKKKGGEKKKIPPSHGSVVTSQVFDSGLLKESIILVYILPNTYSSILYRRTIVHFYDRYNILKGQTN